MNMEQVPSNKLKEGKMKEITTMILAGLLMTGSAQASGQKGVQQVQGLVEEQTGYAVADKAQVQQADVTREMEDMLSQPLTEETAVKMALLNNPSVKAALASLGISEADMREAGILHNPKASVKIRSSNEEDTKTNTEFEVRQDVLDLFFWPLRKRMGNTQFQAEQYAAAQSIADFVREVRLSYFQWLSVMHKNSLMEDNYKAEEAAMEIAQRQKEAGNINVLQWDRHKTIFQKAKIERLRSAQMVENSTQRLRTFMGLQAGQYFMESVKRLPDVPQENLNLEKFEEEVLNNRLDLMMKRQQIRALEQGVALNNFGFLPEAEVGYNQEREASGGQLQGVVIEGEVPVFDRKQADRARIQSQMETAKHQLNAMEQEARLQVRLAYQNLMTNKEVVQSYIDVLPARQEMTRETLYHYNFMLKGVFDVLEIKQEELQARQEYIDALRDYWVSRVELEHALAKKIHFQEGILPKDNMEQPKTTEPGHHHGG